MNNEELIHNAKKEAGDSELEKLLIKYLKRATMRPTTRPWPKIVNDLLTILLLWAVFFFFEKLMMLYVSIHYHYRADNNRIERSKRLRAALVTMYDASTAIYPAFQDPFKIEDGLIAGRVKDRLQFFKSKSTSKIVDHALEEPRAAAALAKRIWMSLVPEGRDVLTVDDIVEVIKSHRRAEAEECFRAVDENQNGDLTLNEMVLTVIETGRARRSIYQGMTDFNRAISALDWICCVVIGVVIAAFTCKCSVMMDASIRKYPLTCKSNSVCPYHERHEGRHGNHPDRSQLWFWTYTLRILERLHIHFPQARLRCWRSRRNIQHCSNNAYICCRYPHIDLVYRLPKNR